MKLSLLYFWFQEMLSLRNLWSLGYQVILSYEHNIASCHSELWPHIPYWWANKCKAEALIEEFEHRKQRGRPGNVPAQIYYDFITYYCHLYNLMCVVCVSGGFFVTGINLTEDLKYICTHPTESLKDLVMSTYPTLLGWVKEQTPGSKVDSLNIIAGDFITESQFVPAVVALNEKLLKWSSWLLPICIILQKTKTKSESQHEIHKLVLLRVTEKILKYLNYSFKYKWRQWLVYIQS